MSFFSGRFEPIETTDEVKNLYRIRDNDEYFRNKKINLINTGDMLNANYDKTYSPKQFMNTVVLHPNDPIYNTLTEKEKVENGLPSKYGLLTSSVMFNFVQWFLVGKKR